MRINTIKVEFRWVGENTGTPDDINYVWLVRTKEDSFVNLTQEELSQLRTEHYYINSKGPITMISFTEKHPMFNIGILFAQYAFTKTYSKVKLALYEYLKSIKYI